MLTEKKMVFVLDSVYVKSIQKGSSSFLILL